MSKDLNQCNFIGRLGKDPETRYMPNGGAVTNFSIACGDDYKDKNTGQKVEKTNWINLVSFNKLAEICGEYLKKGSKVYVSGKHVTRKWQDQSGQDKYSTEIVINDMIMLDSRNPDSAESDASRRPQSAPQQSAPPPWNDFDDDIPFANPYKHIEYFI